MFANKWISLAGRGGLGKPAAGTLRGRGNRRNIGYRWSRKSRRSRNYRNYRNSRGSRGARRTRDRRGAGETERAKYLKVGIGITTNVGLWGWWEWCNFALFFERWFIELYGVLYLRRIGNATETADYSVRKARQSAKTGLREYRYSAESIN